MPNSTKYALRQRVQPTVAPLTAAVSLALGAGNLQAATITVDTLTDGSVAGQCTLRDAFEAANTDAAVAGCSAGSGADEIVFTSGLSGTLTLTEDGLNGLAASSAITVSGPGSDQLTIDGAGTFPIFGAGTADAVLSLSGLTLSNGYSNYGGAAAIASFGASLSLSDCVVSGNVTSAPSFGGGAVSADSANLSITNCEFVGNAAGGGIRGDNSGIGGAVLAFEALSLDISDSSFNNNYASYAGGAIAIFASADANLASLNLSGNEATFGGGLALFESSQATLSQSTISGNEAGAGGGLFVTSGSSLDVATTGIDNNLAYYDGGGILAGAGDGAVVYATGEAPQGGGYLVYGTGEIYLNDSTLAGNQAYRYGGGMAVKYGGSSGLAIATTITGNLAGPVSIRSFRGGGGGSYSGGGGGMATLYGGEAYLAYGGELTDNVAIQGGGVLSAGGLAAVVETLVDGNYGYYGGGLQAALMGPVVTGDHERGVPVAGGTIGVISSTVSGNTADAGGGILALPDGVVIVSDSAVEANTAEIGAGVVSYDGTATVKYSTVINNSATNYGGGISALGANCEANITETLISGNSAGAAGGVYSDGCDFYIGYSTISDNQATVAGGGIILAGTVQPQMLNSTVSGNSADNIGGLYGIGLAANFITVSQNESTGTTPVTSGRFGGTAAAGGALLVAYGDGIDVDNSIFSGNTVAGSPLDLEFVAGGGPSALDYSLVQAPGNDLPTGSGNLIGDDPLLGPLINNGGPTPTHAMAAGSPVIDAGDPATTVEFDQRGQPYVRQSGGRADMGAFERFIDGIFADRFEQSR
ncbi:choice-of-anchor Q domain-containing protein [Wenzhouxiangella sp. EGI_FJ10409]|uniref:choice-of-anchor Q domain-containing protein n=1 Tax=Wenzhouxiangella sp. EGI_FJ10409 TaxID=3243767 RepID=UPI0035E06DC3